MSLDGSLADRHHDTSKDRHRATAFAAGINQTWSRRHH